MGLQIVNEATGAKIDQNSFDPMFWVTKQNFTKNFHTNFHINGSFLGGMVTLRELGLQNSTLRKLGFYRGMGRLTDHLG